MIFIEDITKVNASVEFQQKITTAALTSGGGGYKNIMKYTSPFREFWVDILCRKKHIKQC